MNRSTSQAFVRVVFVGGSVVVSGAVGDDDDDVLLLEVIFVSLFETVF